MEQNIATREFTWFDWAQNDETAAIGRKTMKRPQNEVDWPQNDCKKTTHKNLIFT